MEYNTIISFGIAFIFAWIFVALNANIEFTRPQKRPFVYVFSVWINMIMAFVGLVLTLSSPELALAFTPYVLAGCGLVYTSVDFYYIQQQNIENPQGWDNLKSKVYRTVAVSLVIVFIVFFGLGVKSEYTSIEDKRTLSSQLDSLRNDILESRSINNDKFKSQQVRTDSVTEVIATKVAENGIKFNTESTKQKKVTTAIKKDTEQIKREVLRKQQLKDAQIREERKKFLWIF